MAYFFIPSDDMDRGRRIAEASVAATASSALNGIPLVGLVWAHVFGPGEALGLVLACAAAFFCLVGIVSLALDLATPDRRRRRAVSERRADEAVEAAIATMTTP